MQSMNERRHLNGLRPNEFVVDHFSLLIEGEDRILIDFDDDR